MIFIIGIVAVAILGIMAGYMIGSGL